MTARGLKTDPLPGVKGRTALAGERIGLPAGQTGKRSWELAGGEGVESAETAVELGVGEPALTVERAKKIRSAAFTFPRVAIHTAGDEVTVGVEP